MLATNYSLQVFGSSEVICSTTILRNVLELQLGKAGTPHPENPHWPPLHRKKQEIQLPWPRKLGRCQSGPLAVGLRSDFPSPR